MTVALALALALAACGGGSRNAEKTAREWVAAINAEDWERACELSVTDGGDDCERGVAEGFRDARGAMRIESIESSGEGATVAVTTPQTRNGGKEVGGWTTYGPALLAVERHDGEYLVHFEVTIIR